MAVFFRQIWQAFAGHAHAGMDPLGQFQVKNLVSMHIGGWDVSLTNSALYMVLAAIVPLVFLRIALRKASLIPSKMQAMAEWPFSFVGQILKDTHGEKGLQFSPPFVSLFVFLFLGNAFGMIPGAFTFTSQVIVTVGLALGMFVWMTGLGFYHQGTGFFRVFLPKSVPWAMAPLFVPIEIISYCSRPFSLGVRLFANMMAGHAMMKVFAYFTQSSGVFGLAPLAINMALIGFELMVAFLQAYVFTILCAIYLKDSLQGH